MPCSVLDRMLGARWLTAALLLLASVTTDAHVASAQAPSPPEPAPAPDQPPPSGPPLAIEGFRDAHFGMTETEVRQALHKDFPKLAGKIASAVNPSEKTAVLSLTAPDLLPDTGPARISYIFGYKSKQLIQVNIVWSSDGKSETSDAAVVGTANQLRDYFAAESFKPDSVAKNLKLSDDAILVFRGSDAEGRMVLMVLNGPAASARHEKNPPLSLELSYIKDSAHPDIFKIGKGQF
jgi:hypothetical protein